ncbi:hypothetical protein [Humibacter ginsengiterrae]
MTAAYGLRPLRDGVVFGFSGMNPDNANQVEDYSRKMRLHPPTCSAFEPALLNGRAGTADCGAETAYATHLNVSVAGF